MSSIGNFFMGLVSTFQPNLASDPQNANTRSTILSEPRTLGMPNIPGDSVKVGGSAPSSNGFIVAEEGEPWAGPYKDPVEVQHDVEVESIERDATDQPVDPDLEVPYGKDSGADRTRDRNFARDMSLLRKIDPQNPALETIRSANTIPSVNQARDMQKALLNAECPPDVEATATGRGARPLFITPKAEKIARENQSLPVNQQEVIQRAKLPLGGEVPYQPPKNWKGGELPSENQHGSPTFRDSHGMFWREGRSITAGEPDEWDVQAPKSGNFPRWIKDAVHEATGKILTKKDSHVNISLTGKVTQ